MVWGGVNQKCITKLQSILNFAARVMYKKRKSDHVTPILSELNWLSARNRLKLDTACFMYRVAHGNVPKNLKSLFPLVREKSMRTTRQSDDLYTPQSNTCAGKSSLSYRGTLLWNGLSPTLKQSSSAQSFRRQYKKSLLLDQRVTKKWH